MNKFIVILWIDIRENILFERDKNLDIGYIYGYLSEVKIWNWIKIYKN